jgi:hypothetical protein
MNKYAKKLGNDTSYQRPVATFQEQLTGDEISKKLEGYEEVNNLEEVPLNTHLRYFTQNEQGIDQFRTGGFLQNKTNADKYVILTNGKNNWSVQTANSTFYQKLSHKDEMTRQKQMYETELKKRDKKIKELKCIISEKDDLINKLTQKSQKSSSKNTKK